MKEVKINPTGGLVSIKVAAVRFPQNIVGAVWQYDADKKPQGKIGNFDPLKTLFPVGYPAELVDTYLLVDGVVTHFKDSPASPYKVIVQIFQDGKELYEAVPDNGEGTIEDQNQYFEYPLKFVAP